MVSQIGTKSQGAVDAPNGSIDAGSTGISKKTSLGRTKRPAKELSSEIIEALMC